MKTVTIEVKLTTGVMTPEELPELLRAVEDVLPPGGTDGVVVSGRLPVWAFAAICHLYHPRPWVATFDPRLGKGICIQTHTQSLKVGDTIDVEGAQEVTLEFGPPT